MEIFNGVCLALALSCSLSAQAACSREIRVLAPRTGWLSSSTQHGLIGVIPDFLHEVGSAAGCQFKFEDVPRARVDRMLLNDNAFDVLIAAARTYARDRAYTFVDLARFKIAAVHRREQSLPNSLDNIVRDTAKTALFVRGITLGDAYETAIATLQQAKRAAPVTDFMMARRMLEAQRADFTIVPFPIVTRTQPASSSESLVYTELIDIPRIPIGMYVSSSSLGRDDFETLIFWMSKLRDEGALKRHYIRYYGEEDAHQIDFIQRR